MHQSTALNTLNLRYAAYECRKNGVGLPVNGETIHQDMAAILQGNVELPEIGPMVVPPGAYTFERPYLDDEVYQACTEIALNLLGTKGYFYQFSDARGDYVVIVLENTDVEKWIVNE